MRILVPTALLLAITAGAPTAQSPTGGVIDRSDPALDAIVSMDATVKTLKSDYFGYTEGPVWVPDGDSGYWLFSDMSANKVYKWTSVAGLSVFLERSGFTGRVFPGMRMLSNGRLSVVILGSNGLTLDREGRLVLSAHGDRALVRLEKDGTRTTLVDRYQGKRINGPNDVVMKSDGSFYFSDRGSAMANETPEREVPRALLRLQDGQIQVLDTEPSVNGLAFSPDEKHLYVAGGPQIRRFDVLPDGTLANPQMFLDMSKGDMRGGTDGIKVDRQGNLFTTGPGGVWILSSKGKLLGRILTPSHLTNMAFGDADGRGLFMTSARSIYYIRLKAPAAAVGAH